TCPEDPDEGATLVLFREAGWHRQCDPSDNQTVRATGQIRHRSALRLSPSAVNRPLARNRAFDNRACRAARPNREARYFGPRDLGELPKPGWASPVERARLPRAAGSRPPWLPGAAGRRPWPP